MISRHWVDIGCTAGMLALLAVTPGRGASSFEGLVEYEMQGADGSTGYLIYKIKGSHFRMESGDQHGKGVMLVNYDQKVVYILNPDQKMAMKNKVPQTTPHEPVKTSSAKKVEFVNTGRKERIAGRECTVYSYKDERSEGEICSAQGMGLYLSGAVTQTPSFWESQSRQKALFPLRVTTHDLKNGKTTNMIAKRIEEKSLPASEFEVPADYKIMDLSSMMGMMGGPSSQGGLLQKMMNATPAERKKMSEDMRKTYGQ